MGNVIDISSRLKGVNSTSVEQHEGSATVVDIGPVRGEMIRSERRQVRRTILTEFISVHAVVPAFGVMRVMLFDLNDHGLSFDLEYLKGRYNVGDVVELRVYLNQQTYFKLEAKVAHVTEVPDEGVFRHGCEFVKGAINDDALHHFVKFLETVSASLRRDTGDILVSKINS